MKHQYFFILGNNPKLSIAEIISVLQLPNSQDFIEDDEFLIIEIDKKLDAEKLMSTLGGTIKVGEIVETRFIASKATEVLNLKKIISDIDKDKKFYFGFSIYGSLENKKSDQQFDKQVLRIGMTLKKELKNKNISSRFVTSKEKQLSSVIVQKNKLVSEQGVDWCFLKKDDQIILGKTLAVQEFEKYGERDYGRPAIDSLSGMLPPKLARMLINLGSGGSKNLTLLDPFCGSGTVLQEAAVLGFKNIIGTDLSEKAVADSKQNLEWLKENNNLEFDLSIFQYDVCKLSEKIEKNSIDLIVAEPYMGPPLKGNETKEKVDEIISELSDLYISAFAEFKKILKKDGKISMVWPVVCLPNRDKKFIPVLEDIKKLGFKNIDLLKQKKSAQDIKRGDVVYSRQGQFVQREVLVFIL